MTVWPVGARRAGDGTVSGRGGDVEARGQGRDQDQERGRPCAHE